MPRRARARRGNVHRPQARATLPALMHEVHTCRRLVVPPPAGVRTVWMLGFQRRLVRRCEWETLWPKPGPLPQTSHTLATGISWDLIASRAGPFARQPARRQTARPATWPEYLTPGRAGECTP